MWRRTKDCGDSGAIGNDVGGDSGTGEDTNNDAWGGNGANGGEERDARNRGG